MNWKIVYSKQAKKFIEYLSNQDKTRIEEAINAKLLVDPDLFLEPLTGELKGTYKFRVGDYRIICLKDSRILTVIAVKIGHRREVYH